MLHRIRTNLAATAALLLTLGGPPLCLAAEGVPMGLRDFRAESGIEVRREASGDLQAIWPLGGSGQGHLTLNLNPGEPLIRSLGLRRNDQTERTLATDLDPVFLLTIGERDAEKKQRAFRGMVFFENPHKGRHQTHALVMEKKAVRVFSEGSSTTIAVDGAQAGSFKGELQFTLFRNSPLVRVDAVLTTDEDLRAIVYDAGLSSLDPDWTAVAWMDPAGRMQREPVREDSHAEPLAVMHRVIVAEGDEGSIAVFPAPHQYFYPLDFADNFKFAWHGRRYRDLNAGFGLGIRQPLDGDNRWVPWFDAPAGTEQHCRMFLLLNGEGGEEAIRQVARYTREDRFRKLAGHRTFTSHYHVEHTVDFLDRQKQQGTDGVPSGLENPGFVSKFKDTGVEIVHLGEFHFGWTPGQKAPDRLRMLKAMHEECERLSDGEFLLLPGEEPNVHLGGHWMSFFPKPVYWVMNRGEGEPFVETQEPYGTVYRVGSADDVLELMKRENGLMWTAHARIKGSREEPDSYRSREFFKSEHFLGAAWKAMPADLSRPTLGWRALDLLDDMNQWGGRKQVLGEVDVFNVEPDYELYGHMNINYLRLDTIPNYSDGWQPVLTALREGQFFTTTGEILIPRFTVSGRESGETLDLGDARRATVEVDLEWTFPLAFAEVVSGDGEQIFRERLALTDTESFGSRALQVPLNLAGRTWVRFEVWDVAANGAFTQPVWIGSPTPLASNP